MSIIHRKGVALAGVAGVLASSALFVATAGPAAAATDVKIGTVAINSVGTIPWAQASGIFKKNGLNVTEIKIFPAPPPTLAALAAGAVQFAYAPSIPIINAYANAGASMVPRDRQREVIAQGMDAPAGGEWAPHGGGVVDSPGEGHQRECKERQGEPRRHPQHS